MASTVLPIRRCQEEDLTTVLRSLRKVKEWERATRGQEVLEASTVAVELRRYVECSMACSMACSVKCSMECSAECSGHAVLETRRLLLSFEDICSQTI